MELADFGIWLLEEGIVDIYVMYNIFILGSLVPASICIDRVPECHVSFDR